jgi:hypothetical protein
MLMAGFVKKMKGLLAVESDLSEFKSGHLIIRVHGEIDGHSRDRENWLSVLEVRLELPLPHSLVSGWSE